MENCPKPPLYLKKIMVHSWLQALRHFRVVFCSCFKASSSAKSSKMKMRMQMKHDFHRKTDSLWYVVTSNNLLYRVEYVQGIHKQTVFHGLVPKYLTILITHALEKECFPKLNYNLLWKIFLFLKRKSRWARHWSIWLNAYGFQFSTAINFFTYIKFCEHDFHIPNVSKVLSSPLTIF